MLCGLTLLLFRVFQAVADQKVIEGFLEVRNVGRKFDGLLISRGRIDQKFVVFEEACEVKIIQRGLFSRQGGNV